MNLAETEVFHVEQPSAHLADPAAGDGVGSCTSTPQDVTDAIDGQDVNLASIADTASEITITSSSSDTITVDGRRWSTPPRRSTATSSPATSPAR